MLPLKIGIVGTGIFATDAHLPTMKKHPDLYKPSACYNRSKGKAEVFAEKAGIPKDKILDSLEEIFLDKDLDAIDALLPVQYNLDVIKLALKYKKPMCFEKPIAATIEQAKEIVKLTKDSDLPIFVLEQWAYYKAVDILKEQLPNIGKVISFTYKATGPHIPNKYSVTGWRLKPEHVGGYLSDGGVHQLALLTSVLGHFKSISAHTTQVRDISGTDDILYSVAELDSGVFGTFTYGSAFGAVKKSSYFEIMGEKGSLLYDWSPGIKPYVKVMLGDSGEEPKSETFDIPDESFLLDTEFEVFAQLVQENDLTKIRTTPAVCFHHLAIIDAAIKSSRKDGEKVLVDRP